MYTMSKDWMRKKKALDGGHTLAPHGPPRAGREPGGHQIGMDKPLKDQLT